jgi:hypothetical protein
MIFVTYIPHLLSRTLAYRRRPSLHASRSARSLPVSLALGLHLAAQDAGRYAPPLSVVQGSILERLVGTSLNSCTAERWRSAVLDVMTARGRGQQRRLLSLPPPCRPRHRRRSRAWTTRTSRARTSGSRTAPSSSAPRRHSSGSTAACSRKSPPSSALCSSSRSRRPATATATACAAPRHTPKVSRSCACRTLRTT